MSEFSRNLLATSAALLMGLGAAGCGDGNSATKEQPKPQKASDVVATVKEGPRIQIDYFRDGTREINLDSIPEGRSGHNTAVDRILQFCADHGLYSETEPYGEGGSSLDTTINPAQALRACKNNFLEPSDFPAPYGGAQIPNN